MACGGLLGKDGVGVVQESISKWLLLNLLPTTPKEVPTVVPWMTGGIGSLKNLGGCSFAPGFLIFNSFKFLTLKKPLKNYNSAVKHNQRKFEKNE